MQKVQKTYTPEFKREAVRLAETSGKPMTHIARELGIDFHVDPEISQGADGARRLRLSRQWTSDREGARKYAASSANWKSSSRSVIS
jgi:hypothetical protein